MPENKRQHFVPKFYLRNFAGPGDGQIGVYNIRSERLIRGASLKSQAYRNYFYGADGAAERHFSVIECAASRTIAEILRSGRPPRRFSQDHYRLIYFVMLQAARTARSEADTNARLDVIAKSFIRQQEPGAAVLEALTHVKIGQKDAVLAAVRMALLGAPAIYDLRLKLIHNVSSEALVTSDHPVVLHNQLLEAVRDLNVVGFGAAGLQILLPLSPDYALLFYDDHIYDVGQPATHIVRLTAAAHAGRLNAFQSFGAHENIYVSPRSSEVELHAALIAVKPLRGRSREWIEEVELERSATRKRVRMVHRATTSPLTLEVPFVRLRGPSPDVSGWEDIPMRQPQWMLALQRWTRALEQGELDFDTFRALTARAPVRVKSRAR